MKPNLVHKLVLYAALTSFPASAALVNGDFDTDALASGSWTCSGGGPFTGWQSLGGGCGTGLLNPDGSMLPGGNAPSNGNVAYLNGTVGYWQSAGTWQANQMQTFEILVGQRLDEPYLGYRLELWAGPAVTGLLLAFEDTTPSDPPPGAFVSRSLSYTPGLGDAAIGQAVTVAFRGGSVTGGVQTVFDNASLTAAPEPGTYALVGSALVGLSLWRRKRAQA